MTKGPPRSFKKALKLLIDRGFVTWIDISRYEFDGLTYNYKELKAYLIKQKIIIYVREE